MVVIFDGSLKDLIAIYAAILSTVAILIDVYRWKRRGRIRIEYNVNVFIIHRPGHYLNVTVTNTGSTLITITGLYMCNYKSFLHRFIGLEPFSRAVYVDTKLPYALNPGEQWEQFILKEENVIDFLYKKSCPYIWINHSLSKKPLTKLVKA